MIQLTYTGTFCLAALKGKVDILVQVGKYLGGEINVATTHCALRECFQLGPTLSGTRHLHLLQFIKSYQLLSAIVKFISICYGLNSNSFTS